MRRANESGVDRRRGDIDRLGSQVASQPELDVRQQMHSVREAFRLRRLARDERYLHAFYTEHNLLEEAANARRSMLELLRGARVHWRRTLRMST